MVFRSALRVLIIDAKWRSVKSAFDFARNRGEDLYPYLGLWMILKKS